MAFDVRYRPDLNFDTYSQAVKLQPNSHSKHKNSYSSTAVAALLISPPAPRSRCSITALDGSTHHAHRRARSTQPHATRLASGVGPYAAN
jgi:hypothetical protein